MPANKHICHPSGIYREIMGNTGKYDLQPSTFRLVISIIEFNLPLYFISTSLSGNQLNYLGISLIL